jgi:hypothetical protein
MPVFQERRACACRFGVASVPAVPGAGNRALTRASEGTCILFIATLDLTARYSKALIGTRLSPSSVSRALICCGKHSCKACQVHVNENRHSLPMPRVVTLAAGIASAFFGVPLLLGGGFAILKFLAKPTPKDIEVIGCIAFAIGVFMSLWAFRLISNRPRADGGLVPPWALRIAGAAFIVATPFYVFARHSLFSAWHALGMVAAGLACFGVASQREQKRERAIGDKAA